MQYFVKKNLVHSFPTGRRCGASYDNEQVRDTVPHGVSHCVYCLHRWPADEADQ